MSGEVPDVPETHSTDPLHKHLSCPAKVRKSVDSVSKCTPGHEQEYQPRGGEILEPLITFAFILSFLILNFEDVL